MAYSKSVRQYGKSTLWFLASTHYRELFVWYANTWILGSLNVLQCGSFSLRNFRTTSLPVKMTIVNTAVNALHRLQYIPNIDNTIALFNWKWTCPQIFPRKTLSMQYVQRTQNHVFPYSFGYGKLFLRGTKLIAILESVQFSSVLIPKPGKDLNPSIYGKTWITNPWMVWRGISDEENI